MMATPSYWYRTVGGAIRLFIAHQPYLGGGDPDSLLHALEAVSGLAPELLLVPGHGPVGAADGLADMARYVRTLDGLACRMVEDGQAEDAIDAKTAPELYDEWLLGAFFPVILHFLYQRCL